MSPFELYRTEQMSDMHDSTRDRDQLTRIKDLIKKTSMLTHEEVVQRRCNTGHSQYQ